VIDRYPFAGSFAIPRAFLFGTNFRSRPILTELTEFKSEGPIFRHVTRARLGARAQPGFLLRVARSTVVQKIRKFVGIYLHVFKTHTHNMSGFNSFFA